MYCMCVSVCKMIYLITFVRCVRAGTRTAKELTLQNSNMQKQNRRKSQLQTWKIVQWTQLRHLVSFFFSWKFFFRVLMVVFFWWKPCGEQEVGNSFLWEIALQLQSHTHTHSYSLTLWLRVQIETLLNREKEQQKKSINNNKMKKKTKKWFDNRLCSLFYFHLYKLNKN